jgi:hypothetical protein
VAGIDHRQEKAVIAVQTKPADGICDEIRPFECAAKMS